MPIYEYRCAECGNRTSIHYRPFVGLTTLPQVCPCGGRYVRVYSFSFHRSMAEHFNHSVGRPVSNRQQFDDALKRQSEEMTRRTGIEHNYQPVDLGEKAALGVTDDGMDATYRRQYSERNG